MSYHYSRDENEHGETIRNGNVTPVAQHLLALDDSQCAVIKSSLAERDAANAELDRQLALTAAVIEETADSVVIELPNNPEARHAIGLGCWESIENVVGAEPWTGILNRLDL